jgi:hypothetical protein
MYCLSTRKWKNLKRWHAPQGRERVNNRIGYWGWMDVTPEKNGTSTAGGNE